MRHLVLVVSLAIGCCISVLSPLPLNALSPVPNGLPADLVFRDNFEDIVDLDVTLGTSEGKPAADVRPDGSRAAILLQGWDDNLYTYTRWRLVKAGPDGEIDFDVDIPGKCEIDVHCVIGFVANKAAVQIMPDGGAAVAFMGEDLELGSQARVLRYGPTGELLWNTPIESIRARSHIAGFDVVPEDGRIGLATLEFGSNEDTPGIFCGDVGITFLGSVHVELDAFGAIIRENEYRTSATCEDSANGLGETRTWLTGLAAKADGAFVAVGYKAWLAHGEWAEPFDWPAQAFRIDLDTLQTLTMPGAKLLAGLAASGNVLYTALGDEDEYGGVSFPPVLGSLNGTTVTALAALLVWPQISGVAGTPESLFSMFEETIQRLSDAGAVAAIRTLPDDRFALAATVGGVGQVLTVEQRPLAGQPSTYEVYGGVLNSDLSDAD